jgi:hypothetical protein
MGGYSEDLKEDGPRKVSDWVKLIKAKPYGYASHILPHDGNITTSTGTTFRADLIKLGLTDVRVMQRIKNAIWNRINATQESFERMVFNTDSPGITVMLKHLSMYHTKTENDGLTIKQMPHGDFSSHYADAFGSITQAIDKGYTYSGSGYGSANKKKRKLKIKKFSAY